MTLAKGYSVTDVAVQSLLEMLMMKRPAFSQMDERFIKTFLLPLGVEEDGYGNVIKRIGKDPVIAWSSHTDTVHRNSGYQFLQKDSKNVVTIHKGSDSNCLGADDTAGVWLMIELIKAGRPGLYIFHRSEERGGNGCSWIVKNTPKLVQGIECMVALDRKGNNSVITHQSGGRCCSDDFGNSLAEQMIDACGGAYRLDQGGTFTDSARYVDLLAECTNLSVGYNYQHSRSEELDLEHVIKVREALISMDARDLVIKRKPGEKEARSYGNYKYNGGHNNGNYGTKNNLGQYLSSPDYCPDTYRGGYWASNTWKICTQAEWQERYDSLKAKLCPPKKDPASDEVAKLDKSKVTQAKNSRKLFVHEGNVTREYTILDIVKDYPALVTNMLEDWGFDASYVMEEVLQRRDQVAEDGDSAGSVVSTVN